MKEFAARRREGLLPFCANVTPLAFPEADCSEAIREPYTFERCKDPGSARSDLSVGSFVRGRSRKVFGPPTVCVVAHVGAQAASCSSLVVERRHES